MNKNHRLIFFLDDKCIMCNRFCQFLAKRLEGIEFHSIFSPAAYKLFKKHSIEIKPDVDTSYLWNGDRFLAKSECFFYLLGKMSYPYKVVGWVGFLQHFGADLVYDLIQKNRHKLFVSDSCLITPIQVIPDKELLEIFGLENY
ncbi:DUF393 domain-containing protein [Vibrio cholerae]